MSFEVLLVYFLLLLLVAFGGSTSYSPLQFGLELLFKGGSGFLLLFGFNLLTQFTGYYLPLNPFIPYYTAVSWAFPA